MAEITRNLGLKKKRKLEKMIDVITFFFLDYIQWLHTWLPR